MIFLHRFQPKQTQNPTAYSLVDVGRETVKAAVALVLPGNQEPQVVGYGLAQTGDHDITGGRNEAEAALNAVNEALTLAEDSAEKYIGQKIVPDNVVFAVAGRAVFGKLFSVEQTRPKASAPIAAKEIKDLRRRAEKLVPAGLTAAAFEGGQWLPLAVTDAGTTLDGRLVRGEVGLTGRRLTHAVFGVAVQASALRGLEVLAENLNLSIANVVASPHALASIAPQPEAIIFDIGFSGTDILLIKNDALVATDWTPFGGYFFTQALAQSLGVSPKAARTLKHAYANGSLVGDQSERMAGHLEPAFDRWRQATLAVLTEFAAAGQLPRRVFLTGGASQLPGFDRALKINPAPFEAVPEVLPLGPVAIKDLTDSMNYNLMALALSLTVGIPDL